MSTEARAWPACATVKLRWRGAGSPEIGWAKRGPEGVLLSAHNEFPLSPEMWDVIEEISAPVTDLELAILKRLIDQGQSIIGDAPKVLKQFKTLEDRGWVRLSNGVYHARGGEFLRNGKTIASITDAGKIAVDALLNVGRSELDTLHETEGHERRWPEVPGQ